MMKRVIAWIDKQLLLLDQRFCDHKDIFLREEGRLKLECIECGRKTDGIEVCKP